MIKRGLGVVGWVVLVTNFGRERSAVKISGVPKAGFSRPCSTRATAHFALKGINNELRHPPPPTHPPSKKIFMHANASIIYSVHRGWLVVATCKLEGCKDEVRRWGYLPPE